MVKAKPEHGEIPPHSLLPELSIVVTSTTPAPLADPTVHEPVEAEPLTQIDVKDGLTIRVPRAALTGLTNEGLEATNMSKPPIASDPCANMPTVRLEPTLNGPILGGVAGQLVAVEGKVTQTRPVNFVWATVAPWMLSGRIVLTALTMTTQVLGTLVDEQLAAVG